MSANYRVIGRLILAGVLAALLAGCSPEAGRARGGGPGASSTNYPRGGIVPQSKVFTADGQ